MKQILVALMLITTFAGSVRADDAAATQADRQWSKITVQSVKPTLMARNVFVVRGMHANGVQGGWTLETSYAVNPATKAIQITVAAWAPKGARTTRNLDPVEAKVDVKELAGVKEAYEVIVVDRDGKELGRMKS